MARNGAASVPDAVDSLPPAFFSSNVSPGSPAPRTYDRAWRARVPLLRCGRSGPPHSSPQELLELIAAATAQRKVASTDANDTSSRSHSAVQLLVHQVNFVQGGTKTTGRLNLVDLAGSEKVGKTGAEGDRLKEAQAINLSLTLLGQVIYKLTDGSSLHIPYRDSKLTRILQDSFGGNSRTALLCAVCPWAVRGRERREGLQRGSEGSVRAVGL